MKNDIITTNDVEGKVISIRGQQVLLDRDVAELYGVETRQINQAVKNNKEKFPQGYLFELTEEEKDEVIKNFDILNSLKFCRVPPTAFTERGLYMLATILKSKQAVQTTIAIIDTFTKVRQMARTMEALQQTEDGGEVQRTLLQKTGEILADVVGNNLATTTTETQIELNFAIVKITHKIIRKNDDE